MSRSDREEYEDRVNQVRADVESARIEFEAARKEVSRACKIVPDLGASTPDGTLLWSRATGRYKQAGRAYREALDRFVELLQLPERPGE